ncbi:MAG: hypothetical protein LBG66_00450, partial [Gallionellaceae bacterium]|nr:hypothetical protein [Gallionellaceae bacterium]
MKNSAKPHLKNACSEFPREPEKIPRFPASTKPCARRNALLRHVKRQNALVRAFLRQYHAVHEYIKCHTYPAETAWSTKRREPDMTPSQITQRFPVDRPLTGEEYNNQLRQKKRRDVQPVYNASTIKFNSTFVEMVDRLFYYRGMQAAASFVPAIWALVIVFVPLYAPTPEYTVPEAA